MRQYNRNAETSRIAVALVEDYPTRDELANEEEPTSYGGKAPWHVDLWGYDGGFDNSQDFDRISDDDENRWYDDEYDHIREQQEEMERKEEDFYLWCELVERRLGL